MFPWMTDSLIGVRYVDVLTFDPFWAGVSTCSTFSPIIWTGIIGRDVTYQMESE